MAFLSRNKGIVICFIAVLWLFSFRTNEIPDTELYRIMYENPLSRLDVNEIGYLLLGQAFSNITNADFIAFYLSIITFCMIAWVLVTKKLLSGEKFLLGFCFLLFISFHGFFYFGVTIRNAFSELLIYIGLSFFILSGQRRGLWIFLVSIILATLIHRSAAVFVLVLPFIKTKLSDRSYFVLYFICIFMWLIIGIVFARSFVDIFQQIDMFNKLENYSQSSEAAPSILSLQILSNLILSYCAILCRHFITPKYKYIYNCFLNINMVGLFAMCLLWSVPTSYRFYNMFFFYNFVLLYLMIFNNIKINVIARSKILALIVSTIFFVILIHSFDFMLIY